MNMTEEQNNLKSIRIDRGYTLERMAEIMGTDPGTISRHESGKRKLSISNIRKYAAALQCHPAEIIGGDDNDKPPLSPDEEKLLKNYRKIADEKKQLYLHMGEALQNETFDHGAPQQSEKPTKDERKSS